MFDNIFGSKVARAEAKDLKGQVEGLVKEKRELKETVEDLKLKKRLEQEEIAHLTKINEEKLRSELDREKLKMEQDYARKVTELQKKTMDDINKSLTGFHEKMESKFNSELTNMKEVLALLMKGLPNVNMEITKHIGEPRITDESKKE